MMNGHKVDYHRYMASREWALKREQVKPRADGTCERCFNAELIVHVDTQVWYHCNSY